MPTTALLLAKTCLLLALLLLLAIASIRGRRAKAEQDRLIAGLSHERSARWFRINVARADYFKRRLKLLPYETRGLLLDEPDGIRLLATFGNGVRLDRRIAKSELRMEWLGPPRMNGGNLHWIRIGQGDGAIMFCADTGLNALQSREATADMFRMIAPGITLPESATREFALEKNPASLTVIVLFFALVAYALVDGVIVNRWHLLEVGAASWGLAGAPVIALLCYWLLDRAKVPLREASVISLLLAMAIAAAYLPALKRIDQCLAGGVQVVGYTMGPGAILTPIEPGPPILDFSPRKEDWARYPLGSRQDFRLVHGPLGLWQLDLDEVRERLRSARRSSEVRH